MNSQVTYTYNHIILSYLAGCIDCDGYFTISRRLHTAGNVNWNQSYIPRVGLKQITSDVPVLLKDIFGGSLFIQPAPAERGRDLFVYAASHLSAIQCATELMPYLILKKRQAKLIMQLGISLAKPHSETMIPSRSAYAIANRWGTESNRNVSRLSQDIIDEREVIFQKFRDVQREGSETSVIEQSKHPEMDLPINAVSPPGSR